MEVLGILFAILYKEGNFWNNRDSLFAVLQTSPSVKGSTLKGILIKLLPPAIEAINLSE